MSNQKHTFKLSKSSFCFDIAFAQILAKLPKIIEKLMALSTLNKYENKENQSYIAKLSAKVPFWQST